METPMAKIVYTADEEVARPPWHKTKNFFRNIFNSRKDKLHPDLILTEASKITGLDDFGDMWFLEPLEVLRKAIETEARVDYTALDAIRMDLGRQAAVRLLINDTFKKMPQIADVKLQRPIFITGLPRTGTSFLHNLLAQDPNGRALLFWEHNDPVPPPDPNKMDEDTRPERTKQMMETWYEHNDSFAKIHYIDALGPDECNAFFQKSFATQFFLFFYSAPSYGEYLHTSKLKPAYEFYRETLKMLGVHYPRDLHWVLKAPMHLTYMETILDVFPDAAIINTHREPADCVPSAASLAQMTRKMGCSNLKASNTGAEWRDFLAGDTRVAIEQRQRLPKERVFDVSYYRFIKDPVGMVKEIYDHFGYEFTDEFEQNIRKILSEHKQNRFGKHIYSLEQFSLTREGVNKAFADYRDYFSEYLQKV
jgi:hypothetical protein